MKFTKNSTQPDGSTVGDFDQFDAEELRLALVASGFKGSISTHSGEVSLTLSLEDDEKLVEASARSYFDNFLVNKLVKLKVESKTKIDEAAGLARAKYLTLVPGQESVYAAKEADCRTYVAAGYPTDTTAFPWVTSGAKATGATAKVFADLVISKANLALTISVSIEELRTAGKIDIDKRTKESTVTESLNNTLTELGAI